MKNLIIATRKSKLAQMQTEIVMKKLKEKCNIDSEKLLIVTEGDKKLDISLNKIGGKGLFVKDIELALLNNHAHGAVHSMKDVPHELPEEFEIAAVTEREDIRDVFKTIISQFKKEQRHFEESDYRFTRLNCPYQDTLHNNGLGNEVSYTGMTWSGFRPSDDACKYGYLVPSNMFAVVALRYIEEIAEKIYYDHKLAESAKKLSNEIEDGINKFAVVDHEKYGRIYAYEVDGRGNALLMDDANVPSLLSIPYIEYRTYDDEIYQNTRKFILSKDNPYYYEGKDARGIGSAHTPENYIWHIALSIQGLTTESKQEKIELLKTLISTDGGKGLMHEGFNCDDSHEFTREWFAWSNSMFANFVYETLLEQ